MKPHIEQVVSKLNVIVQHLEMAAEDVASEESIHSAHHAEIALNMLKELMGNIRAADPSRYA